MGYSCVVSVVIVVWVIIVMKTFFVVNYDVNIQALHSSSNTITEVFYSLKLFVIYNTLKVSPFKYGIFFLNANLG